MADIIITKGKGERKIGNGLYSVKSAVPGYDDNSLDPKSVLVTAGVTVHSFTVSSTGALTLYVTDEDAGAGNPVEGAVFYRCDSDGKIYGDPVVTNDNGIAVLENLPYGSEDIKVYYRQVATAEEHDFDPRLKYVVMASATKTKNIANPLWVKHQFVLTDANYENYPVESGILTVKRD